jgi:cellulose synthase/poly-beta-1,6-N-acetylglucosamine synthase-like glycosyltransferase
MAMRSVVLAAYNGEQFIGAQLDSIMTQLAHDDEVIVSDDASVDRTVLTVLGRHDPRIRVINNSDTVGYIKNFQRAISCARGEYIIFSDQDDVWLPNKLTSICSALDRNACVVSDAIVVDKDLNELHASFFKLRQAFEFSFSAVFLKPCFIGATMACRKTYLDTLLPFPPNVPHDFWITLNATWDRDLEVILDPLILYRRHSSTASVSATDQKRTLTTIFLERFRLAKTMLVRRTAGLIK